MLHKSPRTRTDAHPLINSVPVDGLLAVFAARSLRTCLWHLDFKPLIALPKYLADNGRRRGGGCTRPPAASSLWVTTTTTKKNASKAK